MNTLYPIIRRLRRPLLPVDAPAVSPRLMDEERDAPAVVELPPSAPPVESVASVPVVERTSKKGKSKSVPAQDSINAA